MLCGNVSKLPHILFIYRLVRLWTRSSIYARYTYVQHTVALVTRKTDSWLQFGRSGELFMIVLILAIGKWVSFAAPLSELDLSAILYFAKRQWLRSAASYSLRVRLSCMDIFWLAHASTTDVCGDKTCLHIHRTYETDPRRVSSFVWPSI